MADSLKLIPPNGPCLGKFRLPASKSESNRALILQALSKGKIKVSNLSESEDTRTMVRLLKSDSEVLNVGHAGTVMRFMTAYLAFQPGKRILKGSERMHQRPIGLLVEALRKLGANINYLEQEGFPPLEISGTIRPTGNHRVSIPGNVSSQYISALLMVAPGLPKGLELELIEPVFSIPYIQMTLDMMRDCGINADWQENTITIPPQEYKTHLLDVESDWSSAGYAYSICALRPGSQLILAGLKEKSRQGDSCIKEAMQDLGLNSFFQDGNLVIQGNSNLKAPNKTLNFHGWPDQAQTMAAIFAGLNHTASFTGLESLRIKETDRIKALQNELAKFGVKFEEKGNEHRLSGEFIKNPETIISTYDDHRMALAFAPLSLINGPLKIENPDVIVKSFPGYWEELEKLGFGLE